MFLFTAQNYCMTLENSWIQDVKSSQVHNSQFTIKVHTPSQESGKEEGERVSYVLTIIIIYIIILIIYY